MSITAMASYPKTFTDTQGREITLDKAVERIITRSPDEARIVVALGYGDKLIAGEQMTKTCLCPTGTGTSNETVGCLDCYRTIIGGRMPDLPETSTRYDIYYEQIAALKPDIIFCGSLKDAEAFEEKIGCPIVVLGDSFTGVYELMDCEHAGVSAHIAKEIGYPVDLLMSYGGGPNVREKLLRRGEDKLQTKKLVVWMMTARDLFDHAEGWQKNSHGNPQRVPIPSRDGTRPAKPAGSPRDK